MKNSKDFNQIDIPETLTFMTGSEGSADYLILGSKDHFNVGLRPLFDVGGPLIGFRVRIMWGDEEVTPMNIPETLKMTFPEAPFTRMTDVHGSITGGVWLKGMELKNYEVQSWMAQTGFLDNVLTSVSDMLGFPLDHPEDARSVLEQAYTNLINVNTGHAIAKGVKSKQKAEVLAFPTNDVDGGDDDTTDDDGGAV